MLILKNIYITILQCFTLILFSISFWLKQLIIINLFINIKYIICFRVSWAYTQSLKLIYSFLWLLWQLILTNIFNFLTQTIWKLFNFFVFLNDVFYFIIKCIILIFFTNFYQFFYFEFLICKLFNLNLQYLPTIIRWRSVIFYLFGYFNNILADI